MTSARATELVHRATTAWNEAQCPSSGGGSRPAAIRTVDVATGRCEGERWTTHNEVRFTTEPSDGDTLAVTDVTFDGANGGVLTAVTRVFDVYADLGATPGEIDPRMEYVVRHEMGHFLGLAHSEVTESVMNASFRARANDGLTTDDLHGLCAAYSPDAPIGAGCGVALERERPRLGLAWSCVPIAVVLLVAARRRRAARVVGIGALLVLVTRATVAVAAPTAAQAPGSRPVGKKPAAKPAPKPKRRPVAVAKTSDLTDDELAHVQPDTIPEAASPTAAPQTRTLAMKVGASAAEEHGDPAPTPAAPEPDVAPTTPAAPRELYLAGGYRAFVMPRFMLGVVARANKDPLFQAASAQAELHATRGVSIVPSLTFADLSTGDLLVGARANTLASSFSYVKSDLKALAGSVQLVWSLPVSRRVELELGVELGLGVTFGRLVDTWVHETSDGPLEYGGRRFAPCRTVNDGVGCRPQDHGSPNPVKVGDYRESSIFAGGAAPTLVPWVSLPLVGVRTRIGEDVALRLGLGASATGLWAGASLGYLVAKRSSSR
jgi:hypothetical protein